MTKIYTKTGDKGMTSLVGGERVFKNDARVEAYGTVDELSAFAALLGDKMRTDSGLSAYVADIQTILCYLMTAEALLAAPKEGVKRLEPFPAKAVAWLEERIDALQQAVKPIDKFTIPGGHVLVSLCHVCRTVCRRAERAAITADQQFGTDAAVLVWLNRLSDYFYLLGRALTDYFEVEETLWESKL